MKKSIYFFIGTSAELIKIAPVIKELKKRKIAFKLIASGQNRINFEDLIGYIGQIKPYIQFTEKKNKASPFHFMLWSIITLIVSLFKLNKEFKGLDKNNCYFIIHGDTVSSSIGAVIASFYNLKLVYIESGDMSFNLLEPFPEEICRNINIRLADILFPPNSWAENNVKWVRGVKINTKNNTLIESFKWAMKTQLVTGNIKKFKKYYILIMHRQENVIFQKNKSKQILEFVVKNASSKLNCVLLNHPLTVNIINSLNLSSSKFNDKIKITPRIPYPDFMKLMKSADFIATDGATNQLESYLANKPCLVLRNRTEQIEGLGENVVIAKGNKKIIKKFFRDYKKLTSKPPNMRVSPSKIIVDYLINH